MLTFATRFVLKVVVGTNPIRFDLKTECPRGSIGPLLQNKGVLPSKMKCAHVFKPNCLGQVLSESYQTKALKRTVRGIWEMRK